MIAGILLNVFEAVDVITIIKGGIYDDLQKSVGEALLKRPDVNSTQTIQFQTPLLTTLGLWRHSYLLSLRQPRHNLRYHSQISRTSLYHSRPKRQISGRSYAFRYSRLCTSSWRERSRTTAIASLFPRSLTSSCIMTKVFWISVQQPKKSWHSHFIIPLFQICINGWRAVIYYIRRLVEKPT